MEQLNYQTGLERDVEDEIRTLGGDPDFVRFLLAFTTMSPPGEELPLIPARDAKDYAANLENTIKEKEGHEWKRTWKRIRKESVIPRLKMTLRRTLFWKSPPKPNPPHRPFNSARWQTVADLRNYFSDLTGKPKMNLVFRIVSPYVEENYIGDELSLRKEWDKRKGRFSRDNEDNLEDEIALKAAPSSGILTLPNRVLVAGMSEEGRKVGKWLLGWLKQIEIEAELGAPVNTFADHLRNAERLKADAIILIGDDEVRKETFTVLDPRSRETHEIPFYDSQHYKPKRLASLMSFFRANRERIIETLNTGIPFYAQWESDK